MLHLFYSGPQPVLWCKRELTRGKTTTWWKVFQIQFETHSVRIVLNQNIQHIANVSTNLEFKHWQLFSIWASGQRQRWFPLHGGVCQGLQVGRKLHRQIARCPHFAHFSEHGVNISKEEVALYFSSKVPVWNDVTQSRMGPIQPLILKQPVVFRVLTDNSDILCHRDSLPPPLNPSTKLNDPTSILCARVIHNNRFPINNTTNLTNSMEGQWTQKGDQPIMNPVIF